MYPDADYVGPFPKARSGDAGDDERDIVAGPATTAATTADESAVVPPDENADWTQDRRVTRDHVAECLKVLRSASVPGDDEGDIIQKSDRFFDLGVYLHNPFSWNGWVREVRSSSGGGTGRYAVTAGDATHAMPPFLGQGANQALQE